MKWTKMVILFGLMAVMVSVPAFAASQYTSPADAVAGITDRTLESILEEKFKEGKTYAEIANEAGKLEEYKEELFQLKKDLLDEKVADGTLTQEIADEMLAAIEERMAACDGTADGMGLKRRGFHQRKKYFHEDRPGFFPGNKGVGNGRGPDREQDL